LSRPHSEDARLISLVVPLYNEEHNVRPLMERLKNLFDRIQCPWEVVFALDPSPDNTRAVIMELVQEGWPVRLLTFSRRIGKPLSLLAGLDHVKGDACVIIDADLQDPPELIEKMIGKWREGFEVVIAQRMSRKGESALYLGAARIFYWILEKIGDVHVPGNTGDFRLLDARVVREVCRFRERHGFLRGINACVGFSTALIPFDRDPRSAGKTQISVLGSVNIALDGIIPFSRIPVRVIFWLGLVLIAAGGLGGLIWLFCALSSGFSGVGMLEAALVWATILAGLTITCLGIIGEYVVRTYEEVRDRPLYIVDELIESDGIPRSVLD